MKDTSIRYLKGVGPRRETIFNKMGVQVIRDLLYYFPFRYQDRTNIKKISQLKVGEFAVTKGVVKSVSSKRIPYFVRTKKVKSIFEIILEDNSGCIRCVWFNQPYLEDLVSLGSELIIYGRLYLSKQGLQIISPEYEFAQGTDFSARPKIVSIYSIPGEFNQKFMRKIIFSALSDYRQDYFDPLPFHIRGELNIPNIAESLAEIHFPTSWEKCEKARERFIFEELFFSQILVYIRKAKHRLQRGPVLNLKKESIEMIKGNLPFKLTFSQEKIILQILNDLSGSYPMHRILQGEVGCGKTVVAAFAIGICLACGWQAALMVPTEVLAYQHKETLESIFKNSLPLLAKGAIKTITSSLSKNNRKAIYHNLRQGKIKLIIGTHSLIQEEVKFKNLGLVVIDEQHKFGVAQRALLPKKGEIPSHCLIMSATPIPRSLALSLYGDLDLSVITDLPEGRVEAQTILVKEDERNKIYSLLEEKLKQGKQAYIIYPVIEESPADDLRSLKGMYEKIDKRFFKFSVGMFHGKMRPEEKIKIIKAFRDKKIDILVSTNVVEVGIDIKNATVMIVENPERFGLAQLHQLRGRIQRSSHKSQFILLVRKNLSPNSLNRLRVISTETSGFKIAEEDLKIRGPGDFFGQLQHGLPDLKIANPLKDLEILKTARFFAYKVIKGDPSLEKRENRCIREYLLKTEQSSKKIDEVSKIVNVL